jgi:capsule biosynthesis phosphatase
MILLIPLGGIGERFAKNGYNLPKALINLFGKPILYYLLDNVDLQNIDFIYIPYNNQYAKYRFEDRLRKDYPKINFKFLCLDKNTEGAAETINIALKNLDVDLQDKPILCLDGDNFYTTNIVHLWNGENKIITFEDINNNPIYSYISLNKTNPVLIEDIVEKEKISNYACTGAYGFSSYKQLLHYTQKIIDAKIKQKNEYYTSTVIKEMLKDNITFKNEIIHITQWHCLGTPIQIKQFYNNYPKISCLNNNQKINYLRVCFDLDNTLVTFPKIKNDYTSVEPITKNIEFLRYLKTFGHTIIIYTARRMKTHHGNVGKIMSDIGKITFDTLEKFNITYDEIYFGKPQADVYIDDLGLNCFDDLEKSLGFYIDNIKPRDFNILNNNTIEIYTKKSEDLSGEIYYYNNIPKSLKDLFPIFLDYDENNKMYSMEKINGLTVSNLYLSELLTPETLKHIMNSIKRIHSTFIENKDIDISTNISKNLNIYSNYLDKIIKRYESYDYSTFPNSNVIYDDLKIKLKKYEEYKEGHFSIIHGDPVMTNIIINNFDKIKFIDMRGKLGSIVTIYGDSLYDWAKLYQSLIGYDKILLNKDVSEKYENIMKNIFETYFIELYSPKDLENVKLITKSLLFSLIPLHNNEKCIQYFNLISKI